MNDIKLFKQIARMPQDKLRGSLESILRKKYTNVISKKEYIIAEGNIPIALVAHLDTVFDAPPKSIYYDSEQKVMWSFDGLGADDRAGVYAILKILQSGYMPSIIFTTDEEIGGVGAQTLVDDYPRGIPWDINYVIELDRQGYDDCVFYNCGNHEFYNYVEHFGFTTDIGSFSDISIICPEWDIAGVNLSIGYVNEHSEMELLFFDATWETINKVKMMLNEKNIPKFSFMRIVSFERCDNCHTLKDSNFMMPIGNKRYCTNCIITAVDWCKTCGQPFLISEKEKHKCEVNDDRRN